MGDLEQRREDATRSNLYRQDANLSMRYFRVAMIDFREIISRRGRGG
jgi:hypothetical protein